MKESRIEDLIGKLYDMVEESSHVPFSSNVIVNREKLFAILDDLNASVPGEIQMAKDIVAKRDQIIAAAEAEAEKIKKRSEEEARVLVSESEITREARKRSAEMVENAQKKTQEIMTSAFKFCEDALTRADDSIDSLAKDMKSVKARFKELTRR